MRVSGGPVQGSGCGPLTLVRRSMGSYEQIVRIELRDAASLEMPTEDILECSIPSLAWSLEGTAIVKP